MADDTPEIQCDTDPIGSLTRMFVDMVQAGRIARGQCPARRPVFLKPHGVAQATLHVRDDLPEALRVGLFSCGASYPAWVRFSSDTLPTRADFETTVGIGLKLFDTPTPKVFGDPADNTSDLIFQNAPVFFVDTAKDMCAFTKAGVVDGDYQPYLDAHPETARILEEMAHPVGSLLATDYWAILPFKLGEDQVVKYRLEPSIEVAPPAQAPTDPSYLTADLRTRLAAGPARFTLSLQSRTDPANMPLDAATVPWDSPFVPVADLVIPAQDITARGQPEYGERLSYNIWRVTAEHAPVPESSIAAVRKVVYAASAARRRQVNGEPDGEPATPLDPAAPVPCVDDRVVRAAIHPGIGVARVGDAEDAFFIGPELPYPEKHDAGYYRDDAHALKRQAARFRIYGYNAAGQVVRELTTQDADIGWTVEVANRKAAWYRFITALDIPDTVDLECPRRNAEVKGADRSKLAITPPPAQVAGASTRGPKLVGEFTGVQVELGEIRTDEAGRLIFLGGRGRSESPRGKPPFDPADPDTFNNADDWFDDMSDGPVEATVSIAGRSIPVDGAWVVVAPPNYAPDAIGWRTMYDLMTDLYVTDGWMPLPAETRFVRDVLPALYRLSNLQWVNKGFAAMFGKGQPFDFESPEFLARLAAPPVNGSDPYRALRQQIANTFRPHDVPFNDPRIWPWIYGDDFGGPVTAPSPRTMLLSPSVLELHLGRWAAGEFTDDRAHQRPRPASLADVPLADQPATLDRAALDFCLADAFHPGCELTWPMRHLALYRAPYRIRRRAPGVSEPDYGKTLDQATALSLTGPLRAQGPGDLSRWMGLPWQGDTAYCRSGYDPDFDPYLPSFWPARVPNHVLTEDDYAIVVDSTRPRAERVAAFSRRASWYRFIDTAPNIPARMERMIAHFGAQGIVEPRKGPVDDPDFPSTIYVESLPPKVHALAKTLAAAVEIAEQHPLVLAGWGDAEHLEAARNLRARRR